MKQRYLALKSDLGITEGKTYGGILIVILSDDGTRRVLQLVNDNGLTVKMNAVNFRLQPRQE